MAFTRNSLALAVRAGGVSVLMISAAFMTGCGGDTYSADELKAAFPAVAENSGVAEDKAVLCPFQRMLKRSGILDSALPQGEYEIRNKTLTEAAEVFGCSSGSCGAAIGYASLAQGNWNTIEMNRLHEAGFLSHDCGLTFEFGGITVSDTQRDATLTRLAELAVDGRLVYNDLITVKQEICASQGVEMTVGGETEVKLIYAYLGGTERDYVAHSDVDKLLHATMPDYKSSAVINLSLIGDVQ